MIGILFSGGAAAAVAPGTLGISAWITATVFLFILTVYHMKHAAAFMVPLPQIAILISALEYVLAAWAAAYYPPGNPVYDIGGALPYYLSFAGPVVIAICFGWALSISRLPLMTVKPHPVGNQKVLVELDLLFLLGIGGVLVGRVLQGTSIAFVGVLVGYLRFIGVHGRMLLRAPGWKWRILVALIVEVFLAAQAAMFNQLLLWLLWTFGVWLYCFRPRFHVIAASVVAGLILLPALQEAKWRLRGGLPEIDAEPGSAYDTIDDPGTMGRSIDWIAYLGEGIWRTVTLQLPDEFLGDTAARYNQGWIITRVMSFVPEIEPYANGRTLVEAARAAVLPRIVDPNKVESGGRVNIARYAGLLINEQTSMNLGYAGEMYANFGRMGGAIACGAYAMFFGLLFRAFYRRACIQPLWWSLVPFIFFDALKGDDGIADVLTWTVKAGMVATGIVLLFPNFRRALFDLPRDKRRAAL